jgi:hypothetical protein
MNVIKRGIQNVKGLLVKARLAGLHHCKFCLRRSIALAPGHHVPDDQQRDDQQHTVGRWPPLMRSGYQSFKVCGR